MKGYLFSLESWRKYALNCSVIFNIIGRLIKFIWSAIISHKTLFWVQTLKINETMFNFDNPIQLKGRTKKGKENNPSISNQWFQF